MTRWQKQHAAEQSPWDREVLGTQPGCSCTTFYLSSLIGSHCGLWPWGTMCITGNLEPLGHSQFCKIQGLNDAVLLSLGFPYWLSAHNTITWFSGSAERFLMEDSSPPSKVNTILSYCKPNNLVRKQPLRSRWFKRGSKCHSLIRLYGEKISFTLKFTYLDFSLPTKC
jgi:hypothetical protein